MFSFQSSLETYLPKNTTSPLQSLHCVENLEERVNPEVLLEHLVESLAYALLNIIH